MSNCYPSRKDKKTGEVQKSLCENCINNLKIRYIKTSAFWSDDLMKADKDIKEGKVFNHEQKCIYLNLSKVTYYDIEKIIVTKCNQFKKKIKKAKNEYKINRKQSMFSADKILVNSN